MRFFILLTILLALVSCDAIDPGDMVKPDTPKFPEITIDSVHHVLSPGTYRVIPNGVVENNSLLKSVYIDGVPSVLRIKFDPQPQIFTENDELVVRPGEEIVVGIKSGPKTFTEEFRLEIRDIIEYKGTAVANLTRPSVVFVLPPVAPDGDSEGYPPPPPIVDEDGNGGDPPPPVAPDGDSGGYPPPPPIVDEDGNGGDPPPQPEPPQLEPPQPSSEIEVGDRVEVTRTGGVGLQILDSPAGNRIGGYFDGDIGTVVDGPEDAAGRVWYEIEWDAPAKSGKGGCGVGATVCIGWSAGEFLEKIQ